jgi:hypothetical protein
MVGAGCQNTKQQKVATLLGLAEALGVQPEDMSIQQSYENTDPWNEVYSPNHLNMLTKSGMLTKILEEGSELHTEAERQVYTQQYRDSGIAGVGDINAFLDHIDAMETTEAQAYITALGAEPHNEWPGVMGKFSVNVYDFDEAVRVQQAFTGAGFGDTLETAMAANGFPVQKACVSILGDDLTVTPIEHATVTVAPTPVPTPAHQIPGSRNLCTDGVAMVIDGSARIQY